METPGDQEQKKVELEGRVAKNGITFTTRLWMMSGAILVGSLTFPVLGFVLARSHTHVNPISARMILSAGIALLIATPATFLLSRWVMRALSAPKRLRAGAGMGQFGVWWLAGMSLAASMLVCMLVASVGQFYFFLTYRIEVSVCFCAVTYALMILRMREIPEIARRADVALAGTNV